MRPFADQDLIQEAFQAGQCDGWSSDVSSLTGLRSAYPDGPEALTILPEVFSKEPLGAGRRRRRLAVGAGGRVGDLRHDPGRGVRHRRRTNVEGFDAGDDVNLQRFLGLEVGDGGGRGGARSGTRSAADYAVQVVSQVGNYGEIFDRHLASLGLERGVNALWTDGGLLYAPAVPVSSQGA